MFRAQFIHNQDSLYLYYMISYIGTHGPLLIFSLNQMTVNAWHRNVLQTRSKNVCLCTEVTVHIFCVHSEYWISVPCKLAIHYFALHAFKANWHTLQPQNVIDVSSNITFGSPFSNLSISFKQFYYTKIGPELNFSTYVFSTHFPNADCAWLDPVNFSSTKL